MSKLLAANFVRLKKDKVFWLGILCMALYGTFIISAMDEVALENIFFSYAMVIGIVISVFISLHLGTEYSDGTIRNKLIIGHSRISIYLANLVTCITASMLMILAYVVTGGGLGCYFLGFFKADPKTMVLFFLGTLLLSAALSAVFNLLGMLVQNKAISAVIAVLGIFALLFIALDIDQKLKSPETWESHQYDEVGNIIDTVIITNNNYLSGTKREVYETLRDVLPTGQALQYASSSAVNLWQMSLYSVMIILVTTGIGVFVFQRKDIK